MSSIEVISLYLSEGFLTQTKDAFTQLLRTLLAPLLQSIASIKLFLQRFSVLFFFNFYSSVSLK